MEQNEKYKYAAIVLGIIALIFVVLFFTKNSEPIPDTLDQIVTGIESCRDQIAEWRSESVSTTTDAADRANALDNILENCEKAVSEGNSYLEQE
jgi:ABC-type transporter Mla subunit MlaD